MAAVIRVTGHFERSLASVEAYLLAGGRSHAFQSLLDTLLNTTVPTLGRYPDMGRSFAARQAESIDALTSAADLAARLDKLPGPRGELRELSMPDYVILYLRRAEEIDLLSIRHHRQVSFDYPFE